MAFYNRTRKPRVLMGFTEVAGYYAHLEKGFAELGIPARRFMTTPNRFGYARTSLFERLAQGLKARCGPETHPPAPDNMARRLARLLERIAARLAILRYDVFIFSFGDSFDGAISGNRGQRDLNLLRRKGKTVIVVYHGSDIRPPYLNGVRVDAAEPLLRRRTKELAQHIARVEQNADVIVSHPPMAVMQNRPFAQYMLVGLPFAMPAGIEMGVDESRLRRDAYQIGVDRTVIVHAPSNSEIKGSKLIERVIAELQQEGHLIDFVRLQNVPNAVVLSEIQRADFIIDEIYSDTVLAHFATEAAYFGVPAVVCGLDISELAMAVYGEPLSGLAQIGPPEDLKRLTLELIEKPAARRAMGARAREHVRKEWTPRAVAGRFLKLARNEAPKEWFFDPVSGPQFVGGMGLSCERRQELLLRAMSRHGAMALCLESKPRTLALVLHSLGETGGAAGGVGPGSMQQPESSAGSAAD